MYCTLVWAEMYVVLKKLYSLKILKRDYKMSLMTLLIIIYLFML